MTPSPPDKDEVADASAAPPPSRGGWLWSLLLGGVIFVLYVINQADPVGADDTMDTQVLPLAILRGDGPYLDRFAPIMAQDGRTIALHWSEKWAHGHVITRYSIGSVVVSLPFVAIQLAIFDRVDPGWDQNPGMAWVRAKRMSKVAAAIIAALTAVALHRLLRELGLGTVAVPAVLAAALGSDLWVVASQAPWEHGSAALMLTLTMLLLAPRPPGRVRLVLAGATTALIVWCRPIDLIFALTILAFVAWDQRRGLVWFLPGPLLLGAALIAYNEWFFGTVVGGHAELEALHPVLHKLPGAWSGRFLDGLAGTLFSPNRGLFVFCPWALVALATLPMTARRFRSWPLGIWLGGSLIADLVVLSKYVVWWGGHCFGPRYWTEAIPIFAVFLACTLDWARKRCRPVVWVCALTIVISVTIQTIGAFCYQSSWNAKPIDIDRAPGRAWDWSDSELSRCLREGPRPWAVYDDPLWPSRPFARPSHTPGGKRTGRSR